jgi:hypothetical protein
MSKMKAVYRLAVGAAWLMLAGGAGAVPAPKATEGVSDFNGVWAPEKKGPPGAGRRGPPEGRAGLDGAGGLDGADRRGGPRAISAADAAKGLDHGDIHTRSLMTDAGKAKFATYDPLENPASNCQTPGLPSIAQIPELQEWSVAGDQLTIRHESWETTRVVNLGVQAGEAARRDGPHTVLGYATGRMDDRTVVIETTHLNAEWGGLGRNAPGSDQRSVRETYRLVDHDTMEGVIEVSDPLYLTRPLIMPVTLKRQPAGTEIVVFPCDLEVSQRDYHYIRAGVEK